MGYIEFLTCRVNKITSIQTTNDLLVYAGCLKTLGDGSQHKKVQKKSVNINVQKCFVRWFRFI